VDPQLSGYRERGRDILKVFSQIAEAHEATPIQVSLNWAIRPRGVASALIGARTDEQLLARLNHCVFSMLKPPSSDHCPKLYFTRNPNIRGTPTWAV
jgi:aryl-alcohol dehydrogenase-like predicted oxidoreductase